MKIITCIFSILLMTVCFFCSSSKIAGTSEQGNARITAVVYNTDGSPASGVSVHLRRTDFFKTDSSNEPVGRTIVDATTGSDGSFAIDSIDTGSYFIEVNDNSSKAVLLQCSIGTYDTISLDNDTLKAYSVIKGKIESPSAEIHRCVQVKGLERLIEVADDGSFTISDMPAGQFTLQIITVDTSTNPLVFQNIVTQPAQITLLPFDGWLFSKSVYLNTTSSGAAVTADVHDFPVLVRLNSSNFTFGEAKSDGSDIRFIKSSTDSTILPSEIERWDPQTGYSEIWVRVDTVHGNANVPSFIMQWGNPAAEKTGDFRPVFDNRSGFAGVWHLSTFDNSQTPDATPNGLTGTATRVGSTEGMIGKAGSFNNNQRSFITIQNSETGVLNFPVNGNYSISVWVNSDSIANNRVIVGKGDLQYYLRIHSLNWHFAEYHNSPSRGWEFTSSPYTFGKWVYLCGVRKDTAQYLYVDGVCVDSSKSIMSDNDGARNETFNLDIGHRLLPDGSDGLFFSGALDELRVCSTSRDNNWIRLCYMNQRNDNLLVSFGK